MALALITILGMAGIFALAEIAARRIKRDQDVITDCKGRVLPLDKNGWPTGTDRWAE